MATKPPRTALTRLWGRPGARAGGVLVALATAALTIPAVPAAATSRSGAGAVHSLVARPDAPVHAGSGYLALGDSVPFGYRESANLPTPDYTDAANFTGYPEDVAADFSLRLANASCPGETSASLIDATAPSNGCEHSPTGGPGYRTGYPLHVRYAGSQLHFAVRYLRAHPNVRLVTLMVGANDGFLCQETTADHCVSELPTVLAKVAANVATILRHLRGDAGYQGQIVIVNYYSTNYADPTQSGLSQVLNNALDAGAQPYDVRIADGYGAFQRAAAQAGGDSCAAGLLTTLTTGGCGVHPSVAGQQLLAGAVERVVRTA